MTLFQAFGQFAGAGAAAPAAGPGMVLMKPTSIANTSGTATLGADGQVTFSGVTVLSLNECFTADFDNYVVSIRFTMSAGSVMEFRLRAAGSDNSTASSYVYQRLYADGTTISPSRTTDSHGRLAPAYGTQRAGTTATFYGPYLAQPTAVRDVSASDYLSAYIEDFATTHNQSVSYDGFTLFPNGAMNFTGALQVYGLRS